MVLSGVHALHIFSFLPAHLTQLTQPHVEEPLHSPFAPQPDSCLAQMLIEARRKHCCLLFKLKKQNAAYIFLDAHPQLAIHRAAHACRASKKRHKRLHCSHVSKSHPKLLFSLPVCVTAQGQGLQQPLEKQGRRWDTRRCPGLLLLTHAPSSILAYLWLPLPTFFSQVSLEVALLAVETHPTAHTL